MGESMGYRYSLTVGRTDNQLLLDEVEDFQKAAIRVDQIVRMFSEEKVKNRTEQHITCVDITGIFIGERSKSMVLASSRFEEFMDSKLIIK